MRQIDTGELSESAVFQAASQYIQGIDVSEYQNDIDWDQIAKSDKKFVFVRVSHGVDIQDKNFQVNWSGAKGARKIRGPYHYFRPDEALKEQVDYFMDTVGQLQVGDLAPVIDVEEPEVWTGIAQKDRVPLIQSFLDPVEKRFGIVPTVYSSASFFGDVLGNQYTPPLRRYTNWIANYKVSSPKVPAPWPTWNFWQFSNTGSVAGITGAVDQDAFNGSMDALQSLTVGALLKPSRVGWTPGCKMHWCRCRHRMRCNCK